MGTGFKSLTAGVEKRCYAKSKQDYDFEFTASETPASCVILGQDANFFASPVTRDGAGIYSFTFQNGARWKRVYGTVSVGKTGDWVGNVHTVVDGGAAANSFKVETTTGGAADDPEAPVHVHLELVQTEVT
jgi:hypothetical protein